MAERMRKFLKSRLIGQDEAVDDIANLFVSKAVRTNDDRRPLMTLFLNGTSGVGKSMVCELIGEFLNNEPSIKKT
jgi:ATP-dependent Clp protease ATP-binding subunit ClpA